MSNHKQLPDWVFNLNSESLGISRKLADGLNARIFVGDNLMLSFVRIEPHSAGKIHNHEEEQWGYLLEGSCIRIQGDEEFAAEAGDFWHTPSNVMHGIRTGDTGALVMDIFSPPRPEYRDAGEGFGTNNKE